MVCNNGSIQVYIDGLRQILVVISLIFVVGLRVRSNGPRGSMIARAGWPTKALCSVKSPPCRGIDHNKENQKKKKSEEKKKYWGVLF